MAYLWRIPDNYPESLIGEYQREGAPDRFLFRKGERLPETVVQPVIRFNAPLEQLRTLDCLTSNAMVPLVNVTFANLFMLRASSDVELIPARVIGSNGTTDEFYLLNVASKVACIDHEYSDYKHVPGTQQIMSFRKLRYVEGCLGAHNLARDTEYLAHLLVSEVIVHAIKSQHLRDIELVMPTEVNW